MPGNITGKNASETDRGVVLKAASSEVIAGTENTKFITPAGLNAKLGTQESNYLAIGATPSQAIVWGNLGSSDQSITATITPAQKKIDLVVAKAPLPVWHEEELSEAAYFEDIQDHYIYYCNADSPVEMRFKNQSDYHAGYQAIIYSLAKGFELVYLNKGDGGRFRIGDQISTAGTGTVKPPKYGDPTCNAYVFMKYLASKKIWLAIDYNPKEGWTVS